MENIQNNKKKIIDLLKKVDREGINTLVEWLQNNDFFEAPCSTKYHLSEKGGLAQHSINVYKRLYKSFINRAEEVTGSRDIDDSLKASIAIVAICHDICKAEFYKESTRNVKNEQTGQWEKVPCYTIEDKMPLGHGEKSVILLLKLGVKLTDEEIYAIRWHMGSFDDAVKGGNRSISDVFSRCELAYLLHRADMDATYLDEK